MNSCTSPMIKNKFTPSVDNNQWLKRLEFNFLNSRKVSKVVKLTNKKRYYKFLGTSVINSPMSSPFRWNYTKNTCELEDDQNNPSVNPLSLSQLLSRQMENQDTWNVNKWMAFSHKVPCWALIIPPYFMKEVENKSSVCLLITLGQIQKCLLWNLESNIFILKIPSNDFFCKLYLTVTGITMAKK